jgi:hypothetical protein
MSYCSFNYGEISNMLSLIHFEFNAVYNVNVGSTEPTVVFNPFIWDAVYITCCLPSHE